MKNTKVWFNHCHNYHSVIIERELWLNVKRIKWGDMYDILMISFFSSHLSIYIHLCSQWLVVCGTARWVRGQVLSVVCVARICSRLCAVNWDEAKCIVKNKLNPKAPIITRSSIKSSPDGPWIWKYSGGDLYSYIFGNQLQANSLICIICIYDR